MPIHAIQSLIDFGLVWTITFACTKLTPHSDLDVMYFLIINVLTRGDACMIVSLTEGFIKKLLEIANYLIPSVQRIAAKLVAGVTFVGLSPSVKTSLFRACC